MDCLERDMAKRKKRKADFIREAEEIVRGHGKEEKFECPYRDEVAGIIKRLGEIAEACNKCAKENNYMPWLYTEIKSAIEVWRNVEETLHKYESEDS